MRQLQKGQTLSESGIAYTKLQDGDGRFVVNIMVDGVRIHRSIGKESDGVTREKAEQFIAQAKTQSRNGRLSLPEGRKHVLSLHAALPRYCVRLETEGGKDIPSKRRRLTQHVLPFFGDKPLHLIATSDVERFKKARLDAGAKPATINRDLAALSHLMNKAIEWNWLVSKPCTIRRMKEAQTRITYLTAEEAEQLLTASKSDAHPHLYPFVLIGLQTAMRRMEILSLKITDIDLERRLIHIRAAKAGAREQPITLHLKEFLADYLDRCVLPKQTWLFPSVASKTGHTVNIEKPFKRAVIAAGLNPKLVVRHTLRHTAITHLVQAGVDLPTVKRISGHKTLSMVERYSHQNGAHIAAAMDKLEQKYSSRS